MVFVLFFYNFLFEFVLFLFVDLVLWVVVFFIVVLGWEYFVKNWEVLKIFN